MARSNPSNEYYENNAEKELAKALSKYHSMEETEKPDIDLGSKVLNGFFNGGLKRGKITQIAAASGTGKSTIALQMSREICKQGMNVLYIDAEQGVNYSQLNGVNLTKFVDNSDTSIGGRFTVIRELNYNTIKELIRDTCVKQHLFDVVILDSLGVLSTGVDEDINVIKVGGSSRHNRVFMKVLNEFAHNSGCTFVVINHTTPEIGAFVPKEKATGGRAPEYLAGIVLQLSKYGSVIKNSSGVPIAQKVYAEAVKSRYGLGKSKLPFYVLFGKGISDILTYREFLENKDVVVNGKITKALTYSPGMSHLYLEDGAIDIPFRGKDNANQVIKENFWKVDEMIKESDFSVVDTEAQQLIPEKNITDVNEVMIDETEESEE